ncbi:unnamed protein product, partial [Ectocarpus sp. 12 AP-2014]
CCGNRLCGRGTTVSFHRRRGRWGWCTAGTHHAQVEADERVSSRAGAGGRQGSGGNGGRVLWQPSLPGPEGTVSDHGQEPGGACEILLVVVAVAGPILLQVGHRRRFGAPGGLLRRPQVSPPVGVHASHGPLPEGAQQGGARHLALLRVGRSTAVRSSRNTAGTGAHELKRGKGT